MSTDTDITTTSTTVTTIDPITDAPPPFEQPAPADGHDHDLTILCSGGCPQYPPLH